MGIFYKDLEDKNILRTVCGFFSILPNAGQSGPKCSTEHPCMGLPTLVLQGVILGCIQAMKLSEKEEFKRLTCLGHVATEIRV